MTEELEIIRAADAFIETLLPQADAHSGAAAYPLWHGWAIHDAFKAGIAWERQRVARRDQGVN